MISIELCERSPSSCAIGVMDSVTVLSDDVFYDRREVPEIMDW